jgi:peptidoglycan pentaglycine glycine transferase (the first glycine)
MISFKAAEEEGQAQIYEGFFPLTQTFIYGQIQKSVGRKVRNFDILDQDKRIGSILIVEYPLFGNLTYWYAPYGPVLNITSPEVILGVRKNIREYAKENNVVFVRIDFTLVKKNNSNILSGYFKQSPLCSTVGAYFQPRDEWYTNISKTSEEILNTMHSKTRYSVRLAEKKGIRTLLTNTNLLEKLPVFLDLMKKTSIRNGFSLHGDDYYKYYFEEIEKTGKGFVVEGVFEGEVLASHFIFVVGDVAHYVFGASSDEHKDLCAPYLVHFQAMLKAKEMGAKYYNFGAVSIGVENKKWQRLSVFKQKFGGEVFHHEPLYDLVLKPFWYYLYIARKLFKKYI